MPMMAVASARQWRKALSDPPHGKKSAQSRASSLILQHNLVPTSGLFAVHYDKFHLRVGRGNKLA
jgi:hypothetical protein